MPVAPFSLPSNPSNGLFWLFTEQGNEDRWRVTITCTRKLDWHPDPKNLRCVPGCRNSYIADGWCDPSNNNKHCRWDGGDCCASTTRNRIVKPMPMDCTSKCECKDPEAKENQDAGGSSGIDDEDDDDEDRLEGSGSEERQQKTSKR